MVTVYHQTFYYRTSIYTEHMKSDAMKQKEEELIMKKIALVNEKNEIIHRIDEKEEESVSRFIDF